MLQQSTNELQLTGGEYCINVEDVPETPEEMRVHIPKLMPDIELGEEAIEDLKFVVNPSILINSPACQVDGIKPVLTGQNFLTIKPYGNEYPNFRSKAEETEEGYMVPKHNKFALEVQHGDINNMYFTGKE